MAPSSASKLRSENHSCKRSSKQLAMNATLGERVEAVFLKRRGGAFAPCSLRRGSHNPSCLRESLRAERGASGAKMEQRVCRAIDWATVVIRNRSSQIRRLAPPFKRAEESILPDPDRTRLEPFAGCEPPSLQPIRYVASL